MDSKEYIKVPYMRKPECCDECPFARLKSSRPLSNGRKEYNCQVDYYEKGFYEIVREAPFNEYVVPTLCPLVDGESYKTSIIEVDKEVEE